MDVSVDSKRGHRLVEAAGRPTLLGGGLLERARSTTFALLGVTAAVGLAMVALALNQSWPLIAGSAIPAAPHVGIGKAEVVAATSPRLLPPSTAVASPSSGRARIAAQPESGSPGAPSGAGRADLVVSPSAPVSSGGETAPAAPKGAPQPAEQQRSEAPTAAATPAPAPAQASPPATTPVTGEAGTPPPQAAETPTEAEPEEQPSDEDEQGEEEEEEESGGGSHGYSGHGHHWGWGWGH